VTASSCVARFHHTLFGVSPVLRQRQCLLEQSSDWFRAIGVVIVGPPIYPIYEPQRLTLSPGRAALTSVSCPVVISRSRRVNTV
jgi:hypothetical protein